MARQPALSREEAISYLRSNPEFMSQYEARRGRRDFKPLEDYRTEELRRRASAFKKAESEGRQISLTEARRARRRGEEAGKITPERPGRIRHIQRRKGVADQYQVGSKRRPPTGEHLARLRRKTKGNHQGDVVIVIHGLALYEVPGGQDQCLERTASFKINVEDFDAIMEDAGGDIYQVAYLLSNEQRRWCEIWEVSILSAFERKTA